MDGSFLQYGCGCEHGQYGGGGCGCTAVSMTAQTAAAKRFAGSNYGGAALRQRSPKALSRSMFIAPHKRAASREADDTLAEWLLPKKRGRASVSTSRVSTSRVSTSRASAGKSRSRVISSDVVASRVVASRKRHSSAARTSMPRRRMSAVEVARTKYESKAAKNRTYFLRPDRMSEAEKKYCRCLADVGAKQGASCLRGVGKRGSRATGKGCYNPYAICGRLKPKSLGSGGCAMFYNYKTMPYAQTKATADIHNKTIKELVDAARSEAERMKWS